MTMENQAGALSVGSRTSMFPTGPSGESYWLNGIIYDVQETNRKANILFKFEISELLGPPPSSNTVFSMALGQLLSPFTSASQLVKWELL